MFRRTCGDLLVCFFYSHARLRVRRAPGFPCALSLLEGDGDANLGRELRRENAKLCLLLFDPSNPTTHDHRKGGSASRQHAMWRKDRTMAQDNPRETCLLPRHAD